MSPQTMNAAIVAATHAVGDRLAETSEAMGSELSRAAPEFAADEDILRQTIGSIRANMRTGLKVIAGELPVDGLRVPEEALGLARAFVHRAAPLDRLVQAYLLGRGLFWGIWLDELVPRVRDGRVLASALRLSSERIDAYLEVVVSALVREYEREREHWIHSRAARTSESVRLLLRSDHEAPSAELGHDFGVHQTGLILWSPGHSGEDVPARLGACLASLLSELGVRRSLSVQIGTSSLWAWIASSTPLDGERLELAVRRIAGFDDVLIASGRPAPGVDGFRESHRQALRAHHVARRMSAPDRVTSYDAVGVVALLGDNEDEAREFVARQLAGLTGSDPASRRLRETLRAYLAGGSNASRAAAALNTHRNTVLYRLEAIEHRLGRGLDGRRLELELALVLADTLGERVLGGITLPA